MKIVGIAACTSGIAHTYIAKEKLVTAAKELGHEAHIETQGTIGTEDELTASISRTPMFVIYCSRYKGWREGSLQGEKNC